MDIFGNLLKCLKLEMLQNISRISFKSTFYSVGKLDKTLFQNCGKSGFSSMRDNHTIVPVEVHISNY